LTSVKRVVTRRQTDNHTCRGANQGPFGRITHSTFAAIRVQRLATRRDRHNGGDPNGNQYSAFHLLTPYVQSQIAILHATPERILNTIYYVQEREMQ
jgi:hypothetical protein